MKRLFLSLAGLALALCCGVDHIAHAQMEGPAYRNNAPPSLFTPPGAGGVARPSQQVLARTLWAQDYGARCDGVTDDSKAFQNLVTAASAQNVPARFVGTCAINTGFSINGGIDFGGFGMGSDKIAGISSITNPSGVSPITVNTTNPVYLHDFEVCPLATTGTDASITVTTPFSSSNDNSVFARLNLGFRCNSENGAETGINFLKGAGWSVINSLIGSSTIGIDIQNQINVDGCDCFIRGSSFGGSGTASIRFQSGGGVYVIGNKFNSGAQTALLVNMINGVTTSDIFFQGNSVEGMADDYVQLQRAGTTGSLGNVIVSGNEFASSSTAWPCVSVPSDANGNWLSGVIVTNNVCNITGGSATAFSFANTVTGLIVANNYINASGSGNIAVAVGTQSSTNCVSGPNVKIGTFSASTDGTCTTITPH